MGTPEFHALLLCFPDHHAEGLRFVQELRHARWRGKVIFCIHDYRSTP